MPEQTTEEWNWLRSSSRCWTELNDLWLSFRSPIDKSIRPLSKLISADLTTVGRSLKMTVSKQWTTQCGRLGDGRMCQLLPGGKKWDGSTTGGGGGCSATGGCLLIILIFSPTGKLCNLSSDLNCFLNSSNLCCCCCLLFSGLGRFLAMFNVCFGESVGSKTQLNCFSQWLHCSKIPGKRVGTTPGCNFHRAVTVEISFIQFIWGLSLIQNIIPISWRIVSFPMKSLMCFLMSSSWKWILQILLFSCKSSLPLAVFGIALFQRANNLGSLKGTRNKPVFSSVVVLIFDRHPGTAHRLGISSICFINLKLLIILKYNCFFKKILPVNVKLLFFFFFYKLNIVVKVTTRWCLSRRFLEFNWIA